MLTDSAIWKSLGAPNRLSLISGPCVIESEKLCLSIAASLARACRKLGINYVFKASYDKANRTSTQSFRGPGLQAGLRTLARVRAEIGVPILTDVHTESQVAAAAQIADVLQIPAFLCRQTDLIIAAVRTGKIVNLKKGQFLSPQEMGQVVKKAESAGGRKIIVTERGTTFGYNNLVADMRSIPIMRRFGWPVISIMLRKKLPKIVCAPRIIAVKPHSAMRKVCWTSIAPRPPRNQSASNQPLMPKPATKRTTPVTSQRSSRKR